MAAAEVIWQQKSRTPKFETVLMRGAQLSLQILRCPAFAGSPIPASFTVIQRQRNFKIIPLREEIQPNRYP
jgi:hypothetical protein